MRPSTTTAVDWKVGDMNQRSTDGCAGLLVIYSRVHWPSKSRDWLSGAVGIAVGIALYNPQGWVGGSSIADYIIICYF